MLHQDVGWSEVQALSAWPTRIEQGHLDTRVESLPYKHKSIMLLLKGDIKKKKRGNTQRIKNKKIFEIIKIETFFKNQWKNWKRILRKYTRK